MKKFFIAIAFLTSFFLFFLFSTDFSLAQYDYTPLEKIPGFEDVKKFPEYLLSITKFAIWTVGIAALLMIIIGGFWYMTSAGNTSRAETAKKIISDALLGVIIVLIAWLLLFVINPDLVSVNIKLSPIAPPPSTVQKPQQPPSVYTPTGNCQEAPSGPCSVKELEKTCFAPIAKQASAICYAESGGKPGIPSGVDRCEPKKEVVSWGLFQINLSAHEIGGLNCPKKAFDKMFTGKNKECTVIDQGFYEKCVNKATDSQENIKVACYIQKNWGWKRWGVNKKCKF